VQQEDNPPKLDSWLSGYPTAVLADKGTFLLVGLCLLQTYSKQKLELSSN
jgi:hypothetical protein